jgi:formate dehydrogenase subunit beta
MTTHWLLQTHAQPLTTIQNFLTRLFDRADLLGMIAPIRSPGTSQVEARFVQTAPALRHVDPFAPVMRCNAAKLAAELAQEHPTDRLGAVLRPCEVRALVELDRREGFDFSRFLIVGVDCVGTFPVEDYAARASFAGGADALTSEVLQFARSGGLGVNRYRVACQMCDTHMSEGVDLILSIFGLATHEMLLVTVRKDALIDQLGFAEITDGPADPAHVWEHVQAHNVVTARRVRNRERFMQALPQTLPRNLTDLAVHLATRATCHECFKACPLVDASLDLTGSDDAAVQLSRWLDSCVECGMCEQACPRHLLLTVEHEHIRQCLLPAVEPAG